MGIDLNRNISIKANNNNNKSISFIKAFIHTKSNENLGFELNNIVNKCTTTKSLMNKRLSSKAVIHHSIQLIEKVLESILLENKGNISLYQSSGINKLSECKTKDEHLYLSKQITVVNDWNLYFSKYYQQSQMLNQDVEKDEKMSQILSLNEKSTFSNEIVSEINKITNSKLNSCITYSNIKPKTQTINITHCKSPISQPKHSRVKSTNLAYERPVNLNQIEIILKAPLFSNITKKICKTSQSPKTTVKNINELNKSHEKVMKDCCDYDTYNDLLLNDSCFLTHSSINEEEAIHQEAIMKQLNQQYKIDMSSLDKNTNINNVEDMKIVLLDFKMKNSFLFNNS